MKKYVEENNVRYRLCYELDDPKQLMFLTVENKSKERANLWQIFR